MEQSCSQFLQYYRPLVRAKNYSFWLLGHDFLSPLWLSALCTYRTGHGKAFELKIASIA